MRPLTAAVAAAGRGRFVLDGIARMRERPIQDLVDGLVQVGGCWCWRMGRWVGKDSFGAGGRRAGAAHGLVLVGHAGGAVDS
jgi:3-phosphoshikimate 1-carboxyvinyltransferase